MFQLPKGNPLFENLAASKLSLPEVTGKLSNGSFTGYASFNFPTATGILVFESGKLASSILEDFQTNTLSGFEAMTGIANLLTGSGSGTLNVYRLSKDLTMCIHALLQGEVLYKAQELTLVDIKGLLERVKNEKMNGCLRIYTDERSAMIFYKEGNPLGFFHDGSQDIESSASESQQIASMPGAKLDLFTTVSADELMAHDLLDVFNVQKIWETAVNQQQTEMERLNKERLDKERMQAHNQLSMLENDLRDLYTSYVGHVGRGIMDKEITTVGGNSCLVDKERAVQLIAALEKAAKLLISQTKIKEMKEKMNSLLSVE